MASRAVEDAVDAYLATWAAAHDPVITVLSENEQQEAPSDGSAFIIVQFPVANTRRLPVGGGSYLEEGGFRIVINVERGRGTATIREWGEELATLFRDVTVDGVHCLVPSEPFTDDNSDEGNYFTGAMIVPYWYNLTA